jgi:DNA polymerase alpha subunit B
VFQRVVRVPVASSPPPSNRHQLQSSYTPLPPRIVEMEDLPITEELHARFATPPSTKLPPDILGELHSILRLHSISPQELFYKWESYCLKMGPEETRLDLETARALKKDVQETLERETRSKAHARSADKRVAVGSTPRGVSSNDVFDM